MAENSNTYTTTTTGNEPAKPIRLTKKGKENVNKTVSNRTSKKTGISEINFEDERAQIHALKDNLIKNQPDVAHALSKVLAPIETDQDRGGSTPSLQEGYRVILNILAQIHAEKLALKDKLVRYIKI